VANIDLLKMTISQLAPKIRSREVSPVEVTEAALAEADRLQPRLNSFITILHEQAMKQARGQEAALARGEYRGPLQGIPIGIKDNIATSGIRTTLGTKVLADYVPDQDAEVVLRCREAGAIVLGKENMDEFATGATSNNPHYGAVHNMGAGPHSRRFQWRRWRQRGGRGHFRLPEHGPGWRPPRQLVWRLPSIQRFSSSGRLVPKRRVGLGPGGDPGNLA
jgi:hypothetical protein